MRNYSDKELVLYLLTCSKRSLASFRLSRLNDHDILRKELIVTLDQLIDQLAEVRCEIRLANAIDDHGEEIVERLGGARRDPLEPKKAEEPQRGARHSRLRA